jgi:hypothetical protein
LQRFDCRFPVLLPVVDKPLFGDIQLRTLGAVAKSHSTGNMKVKGVYLNCLTPYAQNNIGRQWRRKQDSIALAVVLR